MVKKYKCQCGYVGTLEWVKKQEKRDGGIWESEGLGCPECNNLLSSGKLKKWEENNNE